MFQSNDQLKIISNCPVCNSKKFTDNIKILDENETSHLLFVQCNKCQTKVVVLVTSGMQGLSSIGVLTELNSDEIIRFSHEDPISADDVAHLYEQFELKNKNILDLI